MLRDVDFIAGLGAIAFATAQAILAEQGIMLLQGSGFDIGPGAAASFGMVALGRWYRNWRQLQKVRSKELERRTNAEG